MCQNQTETFPKVMDLYRALEKRFNYPDLSFIVDCFASKEEIETKTLVDAPEIVFWNSRYSPKYTIRRLEGQSHIKYCDVIDQLATAGFKHPGLANDEPPFLTNFVTDGTHMPGKVPVYRGSWCR